MKSFRGRDRNDLGVGQNPAPLPDQLLEPLGRRQIDLVDNQNRPDTAARDTVENLAAAVGPFDHVGHVQDDVGVLERPLHEAHHRFLKLIAGLQEPAYRIDDLEIVSVDDASIRWRVVWAFEVMIDSRSPTSAFISVDLPTFGLPMMLTKPDLCIAVFLAQR